VELYAQALPDGAEVRHRLERGEPLVGATRGWTYTGQIKADRPAADYTARLIPHHPQAAIPLEAAQILWQR
jgi:starch phosphorylase